MTASESRRELAPEPVSAILASRLRAGTEPVLLLVEGVAARALARGVNR